MDTPTVLDVDVQFDTQLMRIEYDARRTNQRAIERRVQQLGYAIVPHGFAAWYRANWELAFSVASGLALLSGWLAGRLPGLPQLTTGPFFLLAYFFGGYEVTRLALHALRARRLDTHVLMILAALGAAALGDYAEGALLLFLFSLGHSLEERALERARGAVHALAGLAPKTALVRRGNEQAVLPVEQLALDDVVIVRPGVRLPVDGEVIAGRSTVDQAPVTGESLPVDKEPGEAVFAGSINGEGALEVRVTRLARNSTLARVMAMVEQAQAQQSPAQQVTERFMSLFVPAVLAAALLLISVPPLFGTPFSVSFLRAMTLLVAASPCALALGTPATILSGVAAAARNGVLIKGGAHLENLGRLRAIAFDKTGTLTLGEALVTDVQSARPGGEAEVLALAAAVESRSAHPLARAVTLAAQERGLEIPSVSQVESLTGRGLRARVNGAEVWVGSRKLWKEAGLALAADDERRILELEGLGQTAILVGLETRLVGLIALADRPRPEAQLVLAALRRLGIKRTVLLSGDHGQAAQAVASQLGLSDVRADLLPQDKLEAVRELVREQGVVGMVGDGVNDAPALAQATVGIAMGGAATEVALETADVALMASNLAKLPFAVGLGQASLRIVRQNLAISVGVILALVGFALSGLAGIGVTILVHEGSTLLVVLNALRLLRYTGDQ
ncbi:MAG TPA: heavy metal translocating P-type ATPase [Anaerolineales bacterium]